ncbi:hypothetical protein K227x_05750 [Rubripirellula lacrimiformis]|uniref:Uncharacterized protein n=1 Tax=Rubripirellula lacrimiformis TaxID=1930273 RepID=A0A517N4Z3_9BACT|nr:hypothetical protein [Rubripirellula lacrimiformis]QDT02203.1 hypothetical protein K227x_05750 [Rubripirellula lacrimiformis]
MARSDKDLFVSILRDLARQVAALDDADFEDIASGAAKLQLGLQGRRGQATAKPAAKSTEEDFRELIKQLQTVATREEGEKLLNEEAALKDELTRLAKCIDVPVRKGDQLDLIRSRIIEATIGYRLSSAAIQGSHEPDESSTE